MELTNVFASIAVILVAIIGGSYWITGLNNSYGSDAGESFNATLTSVTSSLDTELGVIATSAGNNTIAASGAGASTQQEGLISRSLSSIQQVGSFFSIIPNLLEEAGTIVGIPQPFAKIGSWVFLFALGITLALIFLQVVARFF